LITLRPSIARRLFRHVSILFASSDVWSAKTITGSGKKIYANLLTVAHGLEEKNKLFLDLNI
jgi:hypothetical protein